MTENKHDQAKRGWWQFSLRSLLLVMLLAAAYSAGWSTAMRRVREAELEARQQLERARQAERAAQHAATQQLRAASDALLQAKAESDAMQAPNSASELLEQSEPALKNDDAASQPVHSTAHAESDHR